MKDKLFGKTLSELQEIVVQEGMPAFVAGQISDWLYKKHITEIQEMKNLSKVNRTKLQEKYEIGLNLPVKVQTSIDGTKKYLYPAAGKKFIESAYIPDKDRATLCVSSQIGCKMGCLFCMTGKQGFQGQLSAGEIVNQIHSLPEFDKLTNVVYMGMGEPFDNLKEVLKSLEIMTSEWGYGWSPKRITVSTIGIIPAMQQFLTESKAHLAISLHSPFEDDRKKIMPIENVYPLPKLLQAIHEFEWGKQRRISFEYILFKGFNDSQRHVNELAKILNGLKCRINLLRFHPIPDSPLESPDEKAIVEFREKLTSKGITTTIRASRGQDIFAACGLLSTKELQKNTEPIDF
ncbi:MAG: 23S rRNA (adenine(2503)-C(2))-methyltransferase RlmN [Bacteroidetes bacterium HGW-Bacteroidetes-17]|nr:MAG: 23S rRNA (adenine(2503)-C(2))-methyltransferase RlmN [Bacteroidetes bacterium HGW-Bacteroidetes-17]